jgi:uncharacterized protein
VMFQSDSIINSELGLPRAAGIGLKPQHYSEFLQDAHPSGRTNWVEVHPQNFFGLGDTIGGGPPHRWLSAIAEVARISFHSVGLSMGSVDGAFEDQLEKLALLCQRYRPAMVSDHLSFSGDAHHRFADLLPVPYTHASLDHFAGQVSRVQDRLQRKILIENPSRYLAYRYDEMEEPEFIERLIAKTGCGLLLDINNIVVCSGNLGLSATEYLDAINTEWVGEIHLAGHFVEHHESGVLLIDDHGSAVGDYCWELYRQFITHAGPIPTLIEWDTDVPDYHVLMAEALKAQDVLNDHAWIPDAIAV